MLALSKRKDKYMEWSRFTSYISRACNACGIATTAGFCAGAGDNPSLTGEGVVLCDGCIHALAGTVNEEIRARRREPASVV